jgi:hypothetical protein
VPGAGDPGDAVSRAAGDRPGSIAAVLETENDPDAEGTTPQNPAATPQGGQSPTAGITAEHNSGNGSEDSGSGPKPPDGPGPGGDTGQQGGSRQPVWHITSEFHDRKLGMYTDGVNWRPEDVVRDALKKSAKEGQPKAAERHGITDFPQARDLGDNAVGEKPERSPGDAGDLPPAGAELVEMEGERSRFRSLLEVTTEEENLENLHDELHDDASSLQQILQAPAGHAVAGLPSGPEAAPAQPVGYDAGGLAAAGLMGGVLIAGVAAKVHDILEDRRERERQ